LSLMKLFSDRRLRIFMATCGIILLHYCVLGLTGCAYLKEGCRQLLAISTRDIERSRDRAIVKVVDYDYDTCYGIVKNKLAGRIYAERKDLIAIYIGSADTTPAGVFFTEIDKQRTQLEIVSPAKDTREYLADEVFSALSVRIKD
ncbi:MAG: hypothetical protein ABIC18_05575, partial [Candidatus Omnitrophota bacterium]